MIRILLFILTMATLSLGQAPHYFIRLGSFKYLKGLEKSIDNLPYDLRSHVIVVRSNGWYVPFAYNTPRRSSLQRKLPEFKRYFPDAHINASLRILNAPVVHNYTLHSTTVEPPSVQRETTYILEPKQQRVVREEEVYIEPYLSPVISRSAPIERVHIPKPTVQKHEERVENRGYFTKKMLSGHHYYLAYKANEHSGNLLVKVKFENHKVTYQPIVGDMQLADANYIVDNHRLYMYADTFTSNGAYSKIEEPHEKYILVSSWSGGKKLNTLRYYYHLNDAKRYLGLLESQDPLSSALVEGDDFEALDIEDENY